MAGKFGLKSESESAAKVPDDYPQYPAGIRFAGIDGRLHKTRHLAVASNRLVSPVRLFFSVWHFGGVHQVARGIADQAHAYKYANNAEYVCSLRLAKCESAHQPQDDRNDYRNNKQANFWIHD
ncbi:MAG: hypothetical protein LJE57_07095 [Gallionella sp.]|nr:hypothetical protein [Gallionella sp.]